MAAKKSVRKTPAKKPLKTKTTAKKKPVATKSKAKPSPKPTATKKKTKADSRKKGKGVTKKPKKVAKISLKKKAPSKTASAKKKAVAKKTISKKTKTTPKKTVVKSVPQQKKKQPAKKKSAVPKKKTSIAKKKVTFNQAKKPSLKKTSSSASQRAPKSQETLLSANERYNIGGLLACAIERAADPNCTRLRAVLRHLDLSSQEKDNLIRLSQGLMIPKLFADSVAEQKVNQLLADLVRFALTEGSYEKHWREEIRQVGLWLGVFPAQVQEIEQRVKR